MMFVFANFLRALALVIGYVIEILWWLVIIRALLSWVNPDPYNPIVRFIERTTEPLLAPFRKLVPGYKLGIDISPILAILFLYFLKIFLVETLIGLSLRMR
jgi:YggT family protein